MEQQKDSKGAIIGSIIILIVLITGAIYFAKQATENRVSQTPGEEIQTINQLVAEDPSLLEIQGRSSTEISDLENDWQNANITETDSFDYQTL